MILPCLSGFRPLLPFISSRLVSSPPRSIVSVSLLLPSSLSSSLSHSLSPSLHFASLDPHSNRLVNSCHSKCISDKYHEPDLNKGEGVCIDRCTAKFFEVSVFFGGICVEEEEEEDLSFFLPSSFNWIGLDWINS